MQERPNENKQINVYSRGDSFFLRLDKDSIGVKIGTSFARKIAFRLNSVKRYYANTDDESVKTASEIHIKSELEGNHCLDTAFELFGICVSSEAYQIDDHEEYKRTVYENSISVIEKREISSAIELLELVQISCTDFLVWIIVEPRQGNWIHHIGTCFGVDENNRLVIYEKLNSGSGNPWDVVEEEFFFTQIYAGESDMLVSIRKPLINLGGSKL